jgi:hypothetical protein
VNFLTGDVLASHEGLCSVEVIGWLDGWLVFESHFFPAVGNFCQKEKEISKGILTQTNAGTGIAGVERRIHSHFQSSKGHQMVNVIASTLKNGYIND